MVRKVLFETRFGDWVVAWLERTLGIGVFVVEAAERGSSSQVVSVVD